MKHLRFICQVPRCLLPYRQQTFLACFQMYSTSIKRHIKDVTDFCLNENDYEATIDYDLCSKWDIQIRSRFNAGKYTIYQFEAHCNWPSKMLQELGTLASLWFYLFLSAHKSCPSCSYIYLYRRLWLHLVYMYDETVEASWSQYKAE